MEVSGQLHASGTLCPQKEHQEHVGMGPRPVSMHGIRENPLHLLGI